jgi:hypothetical protein
MPMAQLIITAVTVEGRTKSEVARDYRVSRYWVQQLVRRYERGAVTCGTVERPSRLGWNSRSTNASASAAQEFSPRAVHKALNRGPSQSGPEGISSTSSRSGRALLAAHEDVSGKGGRDEPLQTRLDNPPARRSRRTRSRNSVAITKSPRISQRLTDQFFVHKRAVNLSGVEEPDTRSTAVRISVIIFCLSPAGL